MEEKFTTLHGELNHFKSKDVEGSKYVLTSPRALESCARFGIRPVELLYKTLSDFAEEHRDAPLQSVTLLYEAYEKELRRRLRLCRDERTKVIKERKGSRLPHKKAFLESVPEQITERPSSESRLDEAHGGGTSAAADKSQLSRYGPSISGTSGRALSVHLKNHCLTSNSSGARSHEKIASNFSLGNWWDSVTVRRKLDKLTRKDTSITVPVKDRKIAALMLLRREERQRQLRRSQREEQLRGQEQRQEALRQVQGERRRHKALEHNSRLWREDLEARRMRREQEAALRARQQEQEGALLQDRRRRVAKEQEAQRRQRLEERRQEAEECKRSQEQLLKEQRQREQRWQESAIQLALGREQSASRGKQAQKCGERRRLQLENQRLRLRHLLLKREVEKEERANELKKGAVLEEKLRRLEVNRAQQLEAREQELRGRASRGEELGQQVRLRALYQEHQWERDRQVLSQRGAWRVERAAQRVRVQRLERVQKTRVANVERVWRHRVRREKLLQEEEALQLQREGNLTSKEQRCQRLLRDREAGLEAARQAACASRDMRKRIKREIHSHTFDKMALEAELTASLGRCKL